jgi:hypothetical protein
MLKDFVKMFLAIPDDEYIMELARTFFAKFSPTDLLVYVSQNR